MKYRTQLNRLPIGKKAKIISLYCEKNTRRRMQDIGLIPGTEVECLQVSPLNDPIAYWIRGTVIALRKEDSQHILIEYER